MRKNYSKLMVAGMLMLVFMAGCGPSGNVINDGTSGTVPENADDSGYYAGEPDGNKDSKTDTKSEPPEEDKNSQSKSQPQATAATEEIEKELAAYRAEREKGTWSKGGYEYQVEPSGNYKYGVGPCDNGPDLDSRELNLAYKAASAYVEGTLKLKSEVWECVDPRMTAIYEDEDKGVANGYETDNIFLGEYEAHGTWQYLILVREGKGSGWKALYHGSSYKTEKNDGGKE